MTSREGFEILLAHILQDDLSDYWLMNPSDLF